MKSFDIGSKIISRIEAEIRASVPQKAKGYVEITDCKGSNKIIWLVHGELKRAAQFQRNILGEAIGSVEGASPYLQAGGLVLSKNSPFGNALAELEDGLGPIRYKTPQGITSSEVNAKANYSINTMQEDATQGVIACEDGSLTFEESLRKQLSELKVLKEVRIKEEATEEEILFLQEKIKSLEEEIDRKSKNARRYRRTTASIRQQFLLDPEQNKIKRLKLFDGPLIINGGPGTGKTTLLIHRIQYMLDPEVENDENLTVKLTAEEKTFIREQKTGWLFFSPTESLKNYLADAMTAEGLEAHNETVRTWSQHRTFLQTAFGFFNAETGRPFLNYNKTETLWVLNAKELLDINKGFDAFFADFFIQKIKKIAAVELKPHEWAKEGKSIVESLDITSKFTSNRLILVLNDLNRKFEDLRLRTDKAYRAAMDSMATSIQNRLTEEDKEWIKQLLIERRTKKVEPDDEADEIENEELVDAFEDEEVIEGKRLEIDRVKLIKRVIRIDALSEVDKNTRVKRGDKEILDRLKNYINKEQYPKIASYSLFIKYFKPLLKGADSAILSQLPRLYKSFRREELLKRDWLPQTAKEKLQKIIDAAPKNTRLHEDEIDFLLLQALRLARMFFTTSPAVFNASRHPILVGYNSFMKGLIAVDEATDFTLVQLQCMYGLTRPRLSALTLCGDLMQQMTHNGIADWTDVETLLPNTTISSLQRSYRQTPRLLEIAATLYKARFGADPHFYTVPAEEGTDPAPLVFIENDINKKIDWMAERIVELFAIYERVIPNIAVFVKSDAEISRVSTALNGHESLVNHSIRVKGCTGEGEIGSAEFVRVFNINLIKGMEFEAVFFMDVDDYSDEDTVILDKLIYVGVSRATYYLALTLKNGFPSQLLPVQEQFVNGTWSTEEESDY